MGLQEVVAELVLAFGERRVKGVLSGIGRLLIFWLNQRA